MEGSSHSDSNVAESLAGTAVHSRRQESRLPTSDDLSHTTTATTTPLSTMSHHPHHHPPSKQHHERSAVVLALFGRTVGLCVGDFSTTYYHRANGRLYVATQAVLFYSNLFGFERRLCLRYSDIESIERYRSTSIKITMVDYEDHIFRKFVNREHVWQLLTEWHDKSMRSATRRVSVSSDLVDMLQQQNTPVKNTSDLSSTEKLSNRQRLTSESSHSDDMDTQAMMVRQRSQSLPSLETFEALQAISQDQIPLESPSTSFKRRRVFLKSLSSIGSGRSTTPIRGSADIPEESCVPDSPVATQTFEGLSVSQEVSQSSPHVPADFDMQAAWSKAKVPYSEVALDSITLPCSLEMFMDLFFSNEASFPIAKYQTEVIRDRELAYTKWRKSSDTVPPVFDRDALFTHPLSNPLGPSEAKTCRKQRFQRFGTFGATLQNTTNVQGVPGADCFTVEDRWIVEAISDRTVRFTVYFQINFSKRTMIKPLIQKNIKMETKKWFQGYLTFLKRALQHEDYDRKESLSPLVVSSEVDLKAEAFLDTEGKRGTWVIPAPISVTSWSVFVVLFVVTSLMAQLFYLQRTVLDLQEQLELMRIDSLELRALLREVRANQR